MKNRTKPQQYNILILTASIGSGHVAIAKAVAEAVGRMKSRRVRAETVDLMQTFASFATAATKKIYLNSLKFTPKLYELLYIGTASFDWLLKMLNLLSAPFIQNKFLNLIKEKKPSVLVSVYPMWDIIFRKVWQKYCGGRLPFVTIVTDSINVHGAWTIGKPDFFIVPNEDTKISLQNFGVPEKKIRVFGAPIASRFFKHAACNDFRKKHHLSQKKKTLLFIISEGLRWPRIKKILKKVRTSTLKNMQMIIVAARDEKLRTRLKKMQWPWPTYISGWTDEMHVFIHSADIVMTKAGGSTVMECINSGKPLIVADAIPGHETGNLLLVQKYNLGVALNEDASNFDAAASYILNNENLLKKNLAAQQKPRAAENTAKFLAGLCK